MERTEGQIMTTCFQMFQKPRYFGQKSPWRREPGPQRTDATRIRSGSYIILNQSGTSVMWEPEETRDMKNNNVKFSIVWVGGKCKLHNMM